MWETAINARPANRIGTGCQCPGRTFASTTIATPGPAQANEMLRVRSVIRGFMAALSLPTSKRIERAERHGTGKDPPHQLGRPERRIDALGGHARYAPALRELRYDLDRSSSASIRRGFQR